MKTIPALGQCLAITVMLLGAGMHPAIAQRAPVLQSLDVRVPWQPSPVRIDGQWHLSYELHLDNYASDPLRLKRLSIVDAGTGQALREYESDQLRTLLAQPGKTGRADDALSIAPGAHTVVYVDIALADRPSANLHLTHTLDIDLAGQPTMSLHGGAVTLRHDIDPIALSPPLRGSYWVAIYDASWPRGHRRSLYVVNGTVHVPGRFAIDWIKVDKTGHYTQGDATRPENWLGYGQEVLAVADGTVATAMDGMPEPARVDPGKPTRVPLQDASGNYVSLDLGGGHYVFYEHLKTGSVTVKAGQKVRRGEVIGRLGYSGETTGPHLHMHVADANAALDAEGVPYALDGFVSAGSYQAIDDFAKEKRWRPSATGGLRHAELPSPLSVVAFPPLPPDASKDIKRTRASAD